MTATRLLTRLAATALAVGAVTLSVPAQAGVAAKPKGLYVSSHQGNVNWNSVRSKGASFVYVKATEGVSYRNPNYTQQYSGSYQAGLIRGAFHFALPNKSGGRQQADYFVSNGGGWSADGKTLPGALDIEYNPYGSTCYGLGKAALTNWIRAFSNRVRERTGRTPTPDPPPGCARQRPTWSPGPTTCSRWRRTWRSANRPTWSC